MTWDKGFNFRATIPYVTDGANETYSIGAVYPETRNGVTFGWTADASAQSRDRTITFDRRLAGIIFQQNTAVQSTFRVDLPAPGTYQVRLALGDAANPMGYQYCKILDGSTVLATIDDTNGTSAAARWDDATGTEYTDATWPGSNTARTLTFAGTVMTVVIGSPAAQVDFTTIAHLFISQVSGAPATSTTWPASDSQVAAAVNAAVAAVPQDNTKALMVPPYEHIVTGWSFSVDQATSAKGVLQLVEDAGGVPVYHEQVEVPVGFNGRLDVNYPKSLEMNPGKSVALITGGSLGAGVKATAVLRGFSVRI